MKVVDETATENTCHVMFLDVTGYNSYFCDMSILDQVPFNEEYVITHVIHAIYKVKI